MRKTLTLVLTVVLLVIGLVSCHKNNDNPASQHTPGILHLKYYESNAKWTLRPAFGANYELIVTETNGRILLDSLTPFNTLIDIDLKTDSTLVDLTSVISLLGDSAHYVHTYKAIDLSRWAVQLPRENIPYTKARIHYRNLPYLPYDPDHPYDRSAILFSGTADSKDTTYLHQTDTSLDVEYRRYPNSFNYLLFQTLGLYHLYLPKGDLDTVDLTHMETATKANFTLPQEYKFSSAILSGTTDTTSSYISHNLCENTPPYFPVTGADIEYPGKLYQQYSLSVYARASNILASYFNRGTTVPSNIPFPDPSCFTISSRQNSDFSAKFQGVHPTYQTTSWNSGVDTWDITVSGDSTTLNPQTLFSSLKLRKLPQGFVNPSLGKFTFATITGQLYLGTYDSPQTTGKGSNSSIQLSQTFQ